MKSVRSLFGLRKKGEKAAAAIATRSLTELQDTHLLLTKKYEFLEQQILEQTQLAKNFGLGNKFAAKRALKKRAMLQKNLDQIGGMMANVENQIDALAGVNMNKTVIEAMSSGAVALKAANESMNISKVTDMMDNILEQNDIGQEILDVISQPGPASMREVDDDELNKELEALEAEELDKTLLTIHHNPKEQISMTDNGIGLQSGGGPFSSSGKRIGLTTIEEKEEEEGSLEGLREWSDS